MRVSTALIGSGDRRGFIAAPGSGGGVDPGDYDPDSTYGIGAFVNHGGQRWQSIAPVPRDLPPQGIGDGSTADRDRLLAQRNAFVAAANVTGGYDGPTYVVNSLADTNTVGTLRYGITNASRAVLGDPLWVVVDPSLDGQTIDLGIPPLFAANTTLDLRGVPNLKVRPRQGWKINGITGLTKTNPGTINYPDADANVIVAYASLDFDMTKNNQQGFPMGYGFDRVWIHHVDMRGGSDTVTSCLYAGSGGFGNLWGVGVIPQARVCYSWVRMGPITTNENLARWPVTGGDNRPENSKVMKFGLDPEDAAWSDSLEVLLDHVLMDGSGQRQPVVGHSRVRMVNSEIARWATVPGAARAADVPLYVAAGYPSVVTAPYGNSATQMEGEGELIIQDCNYTPYVAGDAHVLDPSWPILAPKTEAVAIINPVQHGVPEGLRVTGTTLRNGATMIDDFGTVWTPSVPIVSRPSGDDLTADLRTGTGNYQPWRLVTD